MKDHQGDDPAGDGTCHCLVVDDSRFHRRQVRTSLERGGLGFQVVEATTLMEARAAVAGRRIDLVLLDNRLPDGTGLTYVRELAALGRLRRLPVVMISGDPEIRLRADAIAAGCAGFVSKAELNPADLAALIGRIVGPGPRAWQGERPGPVAEHMRDVAEHLRGPVASGLTELGALRADLERGDTEAARHKADRIEQALLCLHLALSVQSLVSAGAPPDRPS